MSVTICCWSLYFWIKGWIKENDQIWRCFVEQEKRRYSKVYSGFWTSYCYTFLLRFICYHLTDNKLKLTLIYIFTKIKWSLIFVMIYVTDSELHNTTTSSNSTHIQKPFLISNCPTPLLKITSNSIGEKIPFIVLV